MSSKAPVPWEILATRGEVHFLAVEGLRGRDVRDAGHIRIVSDCRRDVLIKLAKRMWLAENVHG